MIAKLKEKDILTIPWRSDMVRLVTHHEVNQSAVQKVVQAFGDIVAAVYTPPSDALPSPAAAAAGKDSASAAKEPSAAAAAAAAEEPDAEGDALAT